MKINLRVAAAILLVTLVGLATSTEAAGAATRSACAVMPAAQASGILGTAVTTVDRSDPALHGGNSACMYLAGGHPIAQLNIMVHENEAAAEAHFRSQQQSGVSHPNFLVRQKGNLLITDVTMNHDPRKLRELLDAAEKNL